MDQVLVFVPTRGEAETRLMSVVEELSPHVSIRIFRDATSLRRRLVPGAARTLAVVILAATKQDLLSIMPLRELLLSFRVLMILPDSDSVTMAAGWSIWPRFVSYADGDFHDIAGVLHKIIGTTTHKTKDATTHGDQSVTNSNCIPLRPR